MVRCVSYWNSRSDIVYTQKLVHTKMFDSDNYNKFSGVRAPIVICLGN